MSSQVKNRSEESLNNRSDSVVSALNGQITNIIYRDGGLHLRALGEILTIVDAALPPGPQNKSTKDLIKQAYQRNLDAFFRDTATILRSFARVIGDNNHTWPEDGDPHFTWPKFVMGGPANNRVSGSRQTAR